MKRPLSLLLAASLLASPASAYALTMTPISQHYVQPALDRVDDGIANLPGSSVSSNFDFIFFDWLSTLSTAFLELVDTELRLGEYQRDLYKVTPCLHLDLLILEEKLEEVRTLSKQAFEDKRIFDILQLQSMARFLNDRYRNLLRGARDPHYRDQRFLWYYSFDTTTWCCPDTDPAICAESDRLTCRNNGGATFRTAQACGAFPGCEAPAFLPPEEPVCPFHSDYLPPTIAGYGCDLEALDAVGSGGHPAIQAERDGLDEFLQERDDFLNDMAYIGTMTIQILTAIGRPVPPGFLDDFLAALSRTHRTREGCSLSDSPLYNPPVTEFDLPPEWPEGAAKWELRGPFFITNDEFYLVRGLYDQMLKWGEDREQANYIKMPSEFPPGTTERADAEAKELKKDIIDRLLRLFSRAYFRIWNTEQSGLETRPIVQSSDTQKEILEVAQPLRDTMINFYELASKRDQGIRKFTTKFGFFLRRTCLYRPCNKMLDRMLKINFEDQCFPYTSGLFDGNPQHHETCKSAAGVGESF